MSQNCITIIPPVDDMLLSMQMYVSWH